ncbi:biotin biosynthesis protein BioY [Gardnerella vaginalis]|uniref:Biotin transporter n=1 Tax=Gardnerella vaginalis TaxID=2702 RepID=A0A3E1J2A5_GARVA|nr:biotin transporter BioY [Gardnerella vaginalis]RFD80417.1 biotin biosynthesis protein BioY [Gardnerella vaginalis]
MTSMNQNNATTTATAASTATVANKLKTAAVWLAKPALLTVLLALSTMAGAIYLPITPVPITLQTLVLCIIGLTLSWREGVASVVMYLAVGAAGLPVFAGFRGGWAVFVGPTAGFLVGFIFGVAATAALKRVFDVALDAMMPERSFKKTFVRFCTYAVASVIGTIVIYAFGIFGQSLLTGMPLSTAAATLIIFMIGDLIKAFVASAACSGLYNALNKKRA